MRVEVVVGSAALLASSHDSRNVNRISIGRTGSNPVCAKPAVSESCVCFDYEIIALPHTNINVVGSIMYQWDQLGANDSQAVAINRQSVHLLASLFDEYLKSLQLVEKSNNTERTGNGLQHHC